MKVICVVGARPNFMKIAPLQKAFMLHPEVDSIIVHTGQHYDEKMSDVFFQQLNIPKPVYNLGIGGGSHTHQKAEVMIAFEKVLQAEQPDMVIVVGDVNATTACSLTAVKMGIKVSHVEAGLRSHDRNMSEEINRLVTDCISDYLFVTEQSAIDHLAMEGVDPKKVFYVGNLMIDNLINLLDRASDNPIKSRLNVSDQSYVLMTMHRPSNVDHALGLVSIINIIKLLCKKKTVIFSIHPRTRNNLIRFNLWQELESIDNLILEEPLGYLEFLNLMQSAVAVVTDSGGIQEETTYLKVPCITFRDTTERPITVAIGSNVLIKDLDPSQVYDTFKSILSRNWKESEIPLYWDGKTAQRIVDIIVGLIN